MQTLKPLIQAALKEDCPAADITSELCISENRPATAHIIAKEPGIFFGEKIIRTVFACLNSDTEISNLQPNSTPFKATDTLATLKGPIKDILKAERVLLNFIGRLTGIATITNQFVTALDNPKIKLLDTRKTTPTFRELERAAVRAGGGYNHRLNLSDMVLIKENHLTALKSSGRINHLDQLLSSFKTGNPNTKIEVEIETLEELQTYPLKNADYILLDNFKIEDIQKAIKICKATTPKAKIEISGNVTLKTIKDYRNLDIHRISIGCITHSVKTTDISLLLET